MRVKRNAWTWSNKSVTTKTYDNRLIKYYFFHRWKINTSGITAPHEPRSLPPPARHKSEHNEGYHKKTLIIPFWPHISLKIAFIFLISWWKKDSTRLSMIFCSFLPFLWEESGREVKSAPGQNIIIIILPHIFTYHPLGVCCVLLLGHVEKDEQKAQENEA